MSLKITHKNSTTAGTPPSAGDIDVGEIAMNAADAELYTKDTAGNIRKFQNTTTGTADGVNFTQVGTGAVQRTIESKLQDVVSVKDFGAVGDGVAIDTSAIQAALNTGKAVFVPSGTYRVTSSLSITATGQSLYGAGNSSILKDETGSPSFININDKDNVTISDLKVDGSVGSNAAGIAIQLGSKNISIDSVYFYQGGQRVWLFTCDTVRVTNCTFEETGYGIIQQTGNSSSDVLVANNTAINVNNDFVEANCAGTPSYNWVISNNVYEGCAFWPTAKTESRFVGITGVNGVVITGNTAKRVCGDGAVHLEDVGGEVVISNNYFVDVLGTGYIYILNSAENCVITGNILEHRDASITPAPAVWCLNNYSPEIVFSGNRVKGISAAKTFTAFSVGFFYGQLIIANNVFDTLANVFGGATTFNVSFTGNRIFDCTNPLVKTGGTGDSFADFIIANNVFTGTTGTNDLRAGTNSSGTGAPKRLFVTGNKFCKEVRINGLPGGVVGSASDAQDITIINNVFSAAASLVAASGTMSRRNYSGNVFEATGDYSATFDTVNADTVNVGTLDATSMGDLDSTFTFNVMAGRDSWEDYQGGIYLTGVEADYSAIAGGVVRQVAYTTNYLQIGTGFILPKGYSGDLIFTVYGMSTGAFYLEPQSSTDHATWTTLGTYGSANSGQTITINFSAITDATALRFRFRNSNGTTGFVGVQNIKITGLTIQNVIQACGDAKANYSTVPSFPAIGTTASAANAFLDNAADPANRLLRSTSSIRYKTEVEDLETQRADAILGLRPVWYRSLAEADPSEWSYYGLIAEEVAKIEPRLVTWTYPEDAYETVDETIEVDGEQITRKVKRLKDGVVKIPDGVQYDRLPVMLLSNIQRLEQRIANLEGNPWQKHVT